MGDKASAAPLCRLISADGREFEVLREVAKQSVLIREMIEECDDEDGGGEEEDIPDVPLPNVKAEVLEQVLAFCEMYAEDPLPDFEKPLISSHLADFIPGKYVTYVDREREEIFKIISCANYLDIAPLLDLACAKVAADLKAMTAKERAETFGPPVTLTAAQEALVHEYNKWEVGPEPDAADDEDETVTTAASPPSPGA